MMNLGGRIERVDVVEIRRYLSLLSLGWWAKVSESLPE
jgi:hypothetical protein